MSEIERAARWLIYWEDYSNLYFGFWCSSNGRVLPPVIKDRMDRSEEKFELAKERLRKLVNS
jgi:hypothetical protein